MAVGETSGQSGPRRLITAGGGRRKADFGAPGEDSPAENGAVADGDLLDELLIDTPSGTEAFTVDIVEAPVADEERLTTWSRPRWPTCFRSPPVSRTISNVSWPRTRKWNARTRHEHHEAPHFRKESD